MRAVEIIEEAGRIHGQQSRAVQIAVEIIYRTPERNWLAPNAIKDTSLVGKTYGLPQRTIKLIEILSKKYGTRGNVLAACAALLESDLHR